MNQRATFAALTMMIGAATWIACEETVALERRLSSFEVRLLGPAGSPTKRCLLPGTPTAGFDLTGCPMYERDSGGRTVGRVAIEVRAIDNKGQFMPDYEGIASVRVVPGRVEAAFRNIRFTEGIANGTVSFRASFGDTYVWVTDDQSPTRATDTAGLGVDCSFRSVDTCTQFGLTCVNTTPEVGFDPDGLAYCTSGCATDADCESGYFCGEKFTAYSDGVADTSNGACIRHQPTYSTGVAGPIHLVIPNLADVSRTESFISSPFQEEFVEVKRGYMVVTAIRVDGFYVTDTCPLPPNEGGAPAGAPECTAEDRLLPPEFNHLFVFNFSRPEDLAHGDKILSVAGPMTEFVGLTEMAFPLWQIDFANRRQPVPPPVDLNELVQKYYPELVVPGGNCFDSRVSADEIKLIDCDFALERLEAARVKLRVKSVSPSADWVTQDSFTRFGQWRVVIDNPRRDDQTWSVVTRENIPFFNPVPLSGRRINADLIGNVRQVAFDDRDPPIWIIEPRDQGDCPWCTN